MEAEDAEPKTDAGLSQQGVSPYEYLFRMEAKQSGKDGVDLAIDLRLPSPYDGQQRGAKSAWPSVLPASGKLTERNSPIFETVRPILALRPYTGTRLDDVNPCEPSCGPGHLSHVNLAPNKRGGRPPNWKEVVLGLEMENAFGIQLPLALTTTLRLPGCMSPLRLTVAAWCSGQSTNRAPTCGSSLPSFLHRRRCATAGARGSLAALRTGASRLPEVSLTQSLRVAPLGGVGREQPGRESIERVKARSPQQADKHWRRVADTASHELRRGDRAGAEELWGACARLAGLRGGGRDQGGGLCADPGGHRALPGGARGKRASWQRRIARLCLDRQRPVSDLRPRPWVAPMGLDRKRPV